MSLFGALMGDLDEDPIFGHHMRSMRQMNNLMSSLMGDPFSMMSPFDGGFGGGHQSALTGAGHRSSSLMPFGYQSMPNINRLLSGVDVPQNPVGPLINIGDATSNSFCSSSFVSMTQGPDGRPQVYQATSSIKNGPGGIRETRKTVQDSRTGVKKMAIGHHIGERAHIIEKEKNVHEGTEEERQDFINLDEEEAEDFSREFQSKASARGGAIGRITGGATPPGSHRRQLALPAPPSSTPSTTASTTTTPSTSSTRRALRNISKANSRRPLRTPCSSPLALPSASHSPSTTSVHPHPYNPSAARRNFRSKKLCNQVNNSPDKTE